jgi:hypothetical protein
MRPPNYGRLHTKYICSEVKNIWYSKDEELPELPKLEPTPCFCTGLNSIENKEIFEFLYKEANLPGRERQVFYMRCVLEMTLQEVGDCLFVSGNAAGFAAGGVTDILVLFIFNHIFFAGDFTVHIEL